MLPAALLGPIIGKLAGTLADKFLDWQKLKLSREQIQAELEKELAAAANDLARTQASVIMAEAQGESWLQRNWRPLVAITSFFSCWFVIFPYAFFVQWGLLPQVRFGEAGLQYFFTFTTTCVGGYIVGRSAEKVFKK